METLFNFTTFLLLFYFFVNCSGEKSQAHQKINISIIADTAIYVNNEPVKIDKLESRLKELNIDNDTRIIFSADSLTHMGAIYKVQNIYRKMINKSNKVFKNKNEYAINLEVNENENYHIELPRMTGYHTTEYNPNNYFADDSINIVNYWEISSSDYSSFISIIQSDYNQFFIDKNMDRRLSENENFKFIQKVPFLTAKVKLDCDYPILPLLELNLLSESNVIIRQLQVDYIGEILIDGMTMNILLISNPNILSLQDINQLLIGIDINNDKTIGRGEITEFYRPIKIRNKKIIANNVVYSENNVQLVVEETKQDTSLAEGFFHPNLLITGVEDSQEKHISDFHGKITIINWWTTSCAPCVIEIPTLNEIKREYKNEDKLKFIAINISENDSPEKIQQFIKKNEFNFTQYKISSEMASKMGVNGIPRTIIMDKTGKIIFDRVGYARNKSAKELKQEIEKALGNY